MAVNIVFYNTMLILQNILCIAYIVTVCALLRLPLGGAGVLVCGFYLLLLLDHQMGGYIAY